MTESLTTPLASSTELVRETKEEEVADLIGFNPLAIVVWRPRPKPMQAELQVEECAGASKHVSTSRALALQSHMIRIKVEASVGVQHPSAMPSPLASSTSGIASASQPVRVLAEPGYFLFWPSFSFIFFTSTNVLLIQLVKARHMLFP